MKFKLRRRHLFGAAALAAAVAWASLSAPTGAADVQPVGIPGSWRLVFSDDFSGTSLDTTKWTVPTSWHINNVTPNPKDVWVSNGTLKLRLSSATSGGAVLGKNIRLDPGEAMEARIRFPGSDTGDHIYNFPAWWAAGVKYPNSGEHDIAEGLGDLKVTYWKSDKTIGFKITPPGDWNNAYHTFGIHRGFASASVWWDGKRVGFYPTADDGGPQYILLNVGSSPARALITGSPSIVRVGSVRVWEPGTP